MKGVSGFELQCSIAVFEVYFIDIEVLAFMNFHDFSFEFKYFLFLHSLQFLLYNYSFVLPVDWQFRAPCASLVEGSTSIAEYPVFVSAERSP